MYVCVWPLITYKANIVQKVPKDKGRERVRDKLMPFLENFKDIQNQLTDKLEENDIKEGSDVVVCKYVYVCKYVCNTDHMYSSKWLFICIVFV